MKKRILALILASVALLSLSVMVLSSCADDEITPPTPSKPVITPDYPAPPVEEGAEDIGGDDEEKLEAEEGGGAVGMVYSDQVSVDLSDKPVSLLFANPKRSLNSMSLELVVQDMVLMETGTLVPGKRVTTATLKDEALVLSEGVYKTNAKLIVYFYDPETNVRSIVNSEIAVTVTVRQ